jgi:hypothetical protein
VEFAGIDTFVLYAAGELATFHILPSHKGGTVVAYTLFVGHLLGYTITLELHDTIAVDTLAVVVLVWLNTILIFIIK